MENTNSTKFNYLLFSLLIVCSLMMVKKTFVIDNLKYSLNPRNLFEEKIKNYICENAGSKLTDKYKDDFKEKNTEKKSLNGAQQSLIDFSRKTKYSNIKPYFKRIGIFIFFLVLDIILIFLWISYFFCCCCHCCLFSPSKPSNRLCYWIWFFIAAICNVIVIIFSIIVLSLLNSLFSRANGLGCSTFYFLDHVREGLSPSYPKHTQEWEGLEKLKEKIIYSQSQKGEIDSILINIKNNYIDSKITTNECLKDFKEYDKDYNNINIVNGKSFEDLDFNNQIQNLDDALQLFEKTDKDIGNDIYDAFHGHINNYIKRIFKAIFSLTLIFSILGLVTLLLHFFCGFCIFRIIYIIVWNISLLLAFVTILAGSFFGIIGYVGTDAVQVGHYIFSSENLQSPDPLIFDSTNYYISDLVDVCANGNGTFISIIQNNGELYNNIEQWEEYNNNYNEKINILNNLQCESAKEAKEKLINYYEELLKITNKSLSVSKNLTDINCSFAKNDKNIILKEAESLGKNGKGICSCAFVLGIFLLISVFTGILFIHKYPKNNRPSKTQHSNTPSPDDSSHNIHEQK